MTCHVERPQEIRHGWPVDHGTNRKYQDLEIHWLVITATPPEFNSEINNYFTQMIR
jgi:hypothetical protein